VIFKEDTWSRAKVHNIRRATTAKAVASRVSPRVRPRLPAPAADYWKSRPIRRRVKLAQSHFFQY